MHVCLRQPQPMHPFNKGCNFQSSLTFTERLYVYPCEWNFRPDHCMNGIHCESANQNGASIIHGNREVFQNNKQPAFKAVYQGFRDVSSEKSGYYRLLTLQRKKKS